MPRNDVIVSPARIDPVKNLPVVLICRCGAEFSLHPTARCVEFRGDKIVSLVRHQFTAR